MEAVLDLGVHDQPNEVDVALHVWHLEGTQVRVLLLLEPCPQLPFPPLSAVSRWLQVPETSGFARHGGRQEANTAGPSRHRPLTSISHQSGSLPITSNMLRATC